jgi:hypothetical protein
MKYLIILITMFFIISCYEDDNVEYVNPLTIDQCESDDDCDGDRVKPDCNYVLDENNNTERFECTPDDCFGWTGKTGMEIGYSYYTDLDDNCYKKILE